MKKLLFTILVFIAVVSSWLSLNAQEYKPMLVEGNQWNKLVISSEIPHYYTTMVSKIDGDSIINDVSYKKLYFAYDALAANFKLQGLLREDILQQKVYYIDAEHGFEALLYDFSAQVGDIVSTTYYYKVGQEWKSEEIRTYIKSIDKVDVEGIHYKRFFVEFEDGLFGEREEGIILEGIGSIKDPFNYRTGLMGATIVLSCFYQDDILKYKNNESPFCTDCFVWNDPNGILPRENLPFNIFVNSKAKFIIVDCEISTTYRVELADIQGRIILSNQYGSPHINIDTSNMPSGTYILRLYSARESYSVKITII